MALTCINFDDCKNLLGHVKKKQNYELKSFKLESFCKEVRGYLGTHLLLTLTVNGDDGQGNLNFFVKSLDSAGLAECFSDANFFEKEVFTYSFFEKVKQVVPAVDIAVVPKMYYYTTDKTIILENLSNLNYKGVSSIHLDKPHMLQAITSLAKFHAVSIAYEEFKSKELGRKYQINEDYSELLKETSFNSNEGSCGYKYTKSSEIGAKKLIDLVLPDKNIAEQVKNKLTESIDIFFDMINRVKSKYRHVLCHGDTWGYNVLFKYKNNVPIDCKYVDLQTTRYIPPAHDITMLIYHASNRILYQKHIFEYYEFYYKSLTKELNRLNLDITNILPYNEFEETCKVYMPITKLIYLFYRQITHANHEGKAKLAADNRSITLGEKRAWFVENNFLNDCIYKEYLTNLIMDYKHIALNDIIHLEDCFKIVEEKLNSTEYELMDYTLKQLDERGGYLGDHCTLNIKINKEGVIQFLNFFVKAEPNVASLKKFVYDTGAIFKETQFYGNIVPSMLKHGVHIVSEVIPRCYLSGKSFFVADNLKLEDYLVYKSIIPLDIETLKIGLKSIAKLHASGIIYEEKLKVMYNKDVKLNEIYSKQFAESFYTQNEISLGLLQAGKKGIAVLIEMFSNHTTNITPEKFYEMVQMLIDKYPALTNPSDTFRNTICHGDLWSHNMMFKKSKCILVDFQSYRYCPPANDVMQYIYLCSDRKMRSQHMNHLLDYYYSEFKSNIQEYNCDIESILTHKDFFKSCEVEKQLAVTQSLTHFQTILLPKESIDEVFCDPEYCNMSFFVDRSDLLRKTVLRDEKYANRLKEALADVRELCETYAEDNNAVI